MEEIIKTLLLEGIDESTIHRVLDVIEEEYVLISEVSKEYLSHKKDHAKEQANKFLARSVVLGTDKGNKEVEKQYRTMFNNANKRIKKFDEKVKDYLKKKEDNR